MKNELSIRRITAYLSFLVVVAYIVTGYGITNYQLVEKLSFGLLTKSRSFIIHSYLIYPLVVFLAIHVYYARKILSMHK